MPLKTSRLFYNYPRMTKNKSQRQPLINPKLPHIPQYAISIVLEEAHSTDGALLAAACITAVNVDGPRRDRAGNRRVPGFRV